MVKKNKPHLLVIGGTGFIGYNLILAAKKKDWKITCVSLNKLNKKKYIKGVDYLKIDISKLKELKAKLKGTFTYVVNLGGYVNHKQTQINEKKIIDTHFVGLVNLTIILSKLKIKKFIQIGSSAEYGKVKAPQKESDICVPDSKYGIAKLFSTKFLIKLCRSKKFPAIILRFFQVYGEKQDLNRVLPQVIKGCLDNKTFPTSKGDQIRDFCHINDVIKAIFLALKVKNSNGQIFNIGCGKPKKIKDAINEIRKIIGSGKPLFGKIKYRKSENMKLFPNIKKAKKILKWKPKINFKQGILMAINSYK